MNSPARLQIPDLKSGLAYVARLPVNNPAAALPALHELYDSLMRQPLPPEEFLGVLETARPQLAAVLEQHARLYLGKSLPLTELEDAAFRRAVAAWQLAASAYARCAQVDHGNDPGHAARIALVLHRCIVYSGLAIHEHFLARRELPRGLWLELYGYYASAEEWQIATLEVDDPDESTRRKTHCAAALVTVLLTDLAGPYNFGLREIGLIRNWANLWSPLVRVHPVEGADRRPEYLCDLMQDRGLRFSPNLAPGPEQRYLDTRRLEREVEKVRKQLAERVSPVQLGLGPGLQRRNCETLLETIARPWTQATAARRYKRRPASGEARVAVGFEAIHFFVSGAEFAQPDSVRQYSRKDFERIFAYRHMVDPDKLLEIQKRDLDFPVDDWAVLNQSANGFRLERSLKGQRLAHDQLIAIQPPDADHYVLAQTHWLMQERGGGLVAGVGCLGGVPIAIALRPIDAHRTGEPPEPYQRGFMLPAVAAMQTAATLVIPQGMFHTGRVIELFTETAWRVRLTRVVAAGSDFEQVEFVPVG